MVLVYLEDLKGDVAPAAALDRRIDDDVGGLAQNQQALARAKGRALRVVFIGEAKCIAIEPAVCVEVAHGESDADLVDTRGPDRTQVDPIAVRVDELPNTIEPGLRDQQFAVSAGRSVGQRRQGVVDLQHRAVDVVPMLIVAASDRQDVIERGPRRPLPERQHGRELVGRQTDIDPCLCQLHVWVSGKASNHASASRG